MWFGIGFKAIWIRLFPNSSASLQAFFVSAFIEEWTKLVGIYVYFNKNKDDFSVTDGIFYGLLLGGGFGLIENTLYFLSSGQWSQILRSITALPIHMMNGGLIGSFLMGYFFYKNKFLRMTRLGFGFLFCVGIHGYYNLMFLNQGELVFHLPVCLLTLFFLTELAIAKSRILLPGYFLKSMGMNLEEYEMLLRHNRHEGWIQSVQKHTKTKVVRLFQWPNSRHLGISLFFLVPAIVSLFFVNEFPLWIRKFFPGLSLADFFALFTIYPFILSLMVFFGGSLNPYFFRDRMLEVPLFSSVDLYGKEEENTSMFHILWNLFFVPTAKAYEKNQEVQVEFWIGLRQYRNLKAKILWSRENEEGNYGTMCELTRIPWAFLFAWNYLRFRQNVKNLLFRKVFLDESIH